MEATLLFQLTQNVPLQYNWPTWASKYITDRKTNWWCSTGLKLFLPKNMRQFLRLRCEITSKTEKQKSLELGKKIQEDINSFYKDYVKKNFNRTSYLELEFQKLYLSMMFPKLRGKEGSAKKRYAGLIEKNGKEEVEITGLEAIRGDWTEAAQDFQKELLVKTFKKQPLELFIKNYIKDIKSGKLDKKLIYRNCSSIR